LPQKKKEEKKKKKKKSIQCIGALRQGENINNLLNTSEMVISTKALLQG